MNIDIIYNTLKAKSKKISKDNKEDEGFTTEYLAQILGMQRANVARELSKLINQGKVLKSDGRPVRYYLNANIDETESNGRSTSIFDNIIGKNLSLSGPISLAKAAIVYPPNGLHTLIIGETGVGKSFFAKCMFKYALEVKTIKNSNSFAVLNCADYANNPQLLMSYIFGVKKGAYTGANEDRQGIIEKARDGILFLDEVHRLPAEGQEMLFTLMDEGKYMPLGSTKEIKISAMIICATTENIKSTLLKTFKRRIPAIISLPNIKKRTLEERVNLIESFLNEESNRVGKKIEVDEDAMTALLNYECPNNIGGLKSDIQIACAKAYLKNMFTEDIINVKLDYFSEEVRMGLLVSNQVRVKDVNHKINNQEEIKYYDSEDKYNISGDLYEFIEERTKKLKQKGLNEEAIKSEIYDESEIYINNFVDNLKNHPKKNEIKELVDTDLYEFLSNFMVLAEYKLKRKISQNTFLGLLFHINTFLKRLRKNKIIENPKINEIRKKYPEEFKIAMLLSEKLEDKYKILVPIDEIGFITMFFSTDIEERGGIVSVVVAMHGKSTATSMAEVVNELLNTEHVVGFDMPLTMKPEDALSQIEEIIKKKDQGAGAVLLVDMGSLKLFDKIIKNNTGIEVAAVDMATTLTVMEAANKSLMHKSLNEIIKVLDAKNGYIQNKDSTSISSKKEVIITACTTGEGTAQKLKEIIYNKFSKDKYEVINLSMKDKAEFKKSVENIRKDTNIVSIISSFDCKIDGIDYIPMDKFFEEFLGESFEKDINKEEIISTIKIIYRDYLDINDADYIVDNLMNVITDLNKKFDIYLDSDKLNGLLMHFGCLVQKIIDKDDRSRCRNLDRILSRHNDIFNCIKDGIVDIEKKLKIRLDNDDVGNIVEILINI